MDNSTANGSPKEAASSKEAAGLHEENTRANVASDGLGDGCDRKTLLDVAKKSKGAVLADEIAEEEGFVLRLTPSDDEDLIEDAAEGKVTKKVALDLLEKYFSDIESSDDSQVYEPKTSRSDDKRRGATAVAALETVKRSEEDSKLSTGSGKDEQEKLVGLEFEPVESEEEDFEDSQQSGEKEKTVDGGEADADKQLMDQKDSEEGKSMSVEDEGSFDSPEPVEDVGEDTMTDLLEKPQVMLEEDSRESEGRDDIFYSPTGEANLSAEENLTRGGDPNLQDLVELVSEEEDILEKIEEIAEVSTPAPASVGSEVAADTEDSGLSKDVGDEREGTPLNDEPEEEVTISEVVEVTTVEGAEDDKSASKTEELATEKDVEAEGEVGKKLDGASAEKLGTSTQTLETSTETRGAPKKTLGASQEVSKPLKTVEDLLLEDDSVDNEEEDSNLSKSAEELLLEETPEVSPEIPEIAEEILLEETLEEVTEATDGAEDMPVQEKSLDGTVEKDEELQAIEEDDLLEEKSQELSEEISSEVSVENSLIALDEKSLEEKSQKVSVEKSSKESNENSLEVSEEKTRETAKQKPSEGSLKEDAPLEKRAEDVLLEGDSSEGNSIEDSVSKKDEKVAKSVEASEEEVSESLETTRDVSLEENFSEKALKTAKELAEPLTRIEAATIPLEPSAKKPNETLKESETSKELETVKESETSTDLSGQKLSEPPTKADDVVMENSPSTSLKRGPKRPRSKEGDLLEKDHPEPPQEKILKTTADVKTFNPFKTLEEVFMEEELEEERRKAQAAEEDVGEDESQKADAEKQDLDDKAEEKKCTQTGPDASTEKTETVPESSVPAAEKKSDGVKSSELQETQKAVQEETTQSKGEAPKLVTKESEGSEETSEAPATIEKVEKTKAAADDPVKVSEIVEDDKADASSSPKPNEKDDELAPKAITNEPAEAPTQIVKTLAGSSVFGPDIEPIQFKENTEKRVLPQPCCSKDIEMMETEVTSKKDYPPPPSSAAAPSPTSDEEDSLLVIDTSRREEDSEAERAEAAAQQSSSSSSASPTPSSSSEEELEVFHGKECVNYDCDQSSDVYFQAPVFGLNYYKVVRKRKKAQYLCENCYDKAIGSYEDMCKVLTQKQPLLERADVVRQEFVEIIDSSDEEDSDDTEESSKDDNALPRESIDLLSAELETAIRKVMNSVDIHNQLTWTKQILSQRLDNLTEEADSVSERLLELQKKADQMHNSLYQCPKIKIRQLTPLDLNSGRTFQSETEDTIPPHGEIVRAEIQVNETYYAVKNKAIASWVLCKVTETVDNVPNMGNLKHFKVKFIKSKYQMMKTVSAKHMAYFNPPEVRLPIGTRVIAYFDATSLSKGKDKVLIPSAFYPGIIAEPLKEMNKFRYLVFYDDGYFQYVYHKDVRLVCNSSENVWEDVHPQSREFMRAYLTQYTVSRPMVYTQKGQSMLVDYMGKWIYSRVIDVDCSLVQVLFEAQHRSEWIYRGSARLGPVYKEYNNLAPRNNWSSSRSVRRSEPYVQYVNCDDIFPTPKPAPAPQPPPQQKPGEVRSVAKKSVSRVDSVPNTTPVPAVRHLNNSTIFVDDDNKPKGKVVYYTARKNAPPRKYEPHLCSPTCQYQISHNLQYYSPLAKPLLSGWERQIMRQKSKRFIVYRGPCGKRLRCMEELHRYLRLTESELNVDNFDFGPETNCLAEYVIESCIVQKKDISYGQEQMPIPCVNYYDNTMPPDCIYSSRRIPTEGVPLNLDTEFLVGCDCEDDCSDKSKCSCWELTYAGAKYGMPNVPNEMVGYQYKRLYEHVPTGIYECNSRCKCKANCVNRVVQQPLQSKLQVFKTSNRGWGLRCINDVPRGSFICIYAGHLLTEQKANEGGLDAGDEYFAELDYIEVAEQIKEGYESDVVEPDEDEDLYNPDKDDDDDEFVGPGDSSRSKSFNTRSRTRKSANGDHVSQERQVMSFEPNKTIGQPDNSNSEKPTIRKLFGKDEACYIMDAKITGNLGRYFNHSCSPNLFVQNVFVDTHDLRFPWVAFFAFTHIRAGTELTWNYNYEVGVVPGKVLYCQCGAPNCRQRLL